MASLSVMSRRRLFLRWLRAGVSGCVAFTAFVITLFASPSTRAAALWWDGVNNASWANAASWSTVSYSTSPASGAAPALGDNVFFNIAGVNSGETVDLNGSQAANSLTFGSTGTVNIVAGSGINSLTLGTGGITMVSGAGAATISTTAALAGNQPWSVGNLDVLSFNSLLTTSTNSVAAKTGLGELFIQYNGNSSGPTPSNFTIDGEQGRVVLDQGTSFLPQMGFYFNGGSYFNRWSQGTAGNAINIAVGPAGVQWEAALNSLDFASNGTAAYVYIGGTSAAPVSVIKSGYAGMYFGKNSNTSASNTFYQGNLYFNYLGIGGVYAISQDAAGRTSRLYNTQLIGGGVEVYDAAQLANGTSSSISIVNSPASAATFLCALNNTGTNSSFFTATNLQSMIAKNSNGVLILPAGGDSDSYNMANFGNGLMFLSAQSTGANNNTFTGSLAPDADGTYRLGGNPTASAANETSTGLVVQNATLNAGANLIVGSGLAGSRGTVWLRQISSAFNGAVTINADTVSTISQYNTMTLSLSYSGALPNASSYTLNADTDLYLDNSSGGFNLSNRLSGTAPISMDNASKLVLNSASASGATQSIGPVTAIGFAASAWSSTAVPACRFLPPAT